MTAVTLTHDEYLVREVLESELEDVGEVTFRGLTIACLAPKPHRLNGPNCC